jgi:hypothetical protein
MGMYRTLPHLINTVRVWGAVGLYVFLYVSCLNDTYQPIEAYLIITGFHWDSAATETFNLRLSATHSAPTPAILASTIWWMQTVRH